MKPADLVLRCYARRDSDGSWFTICLDLNLYARADTYEEARERLHGYISKYMKEALTEDSAYFADLVPRRAPLRFWIEYAAIFCLLKAVDWATTKRDADHRKFKEHLPLVPAGA